MNPDERDHVARLHDTLLDIKRLCSLHYGGPNVCQCELIAKALAGPATEALDEARRAVSPLTGKQPAATWGSLLRLAMFDPVAHAAIKLQAQGALSREEVLLELVLHLAAERYGYKQQLTRHIDKTPSSRVFTDRNRR